MDSRTNTKEWDKISKKVVMYHMSLSRRPLLIFTDNVYRPSYKPKTDCKPSLNKRKIILIQFPKYLFALVTHIYEEEKKEKKKMYIITSFKCYFHTQLYSIIMNSNQGFIYQPLRRTRRTDSVTYLEYILIFIMNT